MNYWNYVNSFVHTVSNTVVVSSEYSEKFDFGVKQSRSGPIKPLRFFLSRLWQYCRYFKYIQSIPTNILLNTNYFILFLFKNIENASTI